MVKRMERLKSVASEDLMRMLQATMEEVAVSTHMLAVESGKRRSMVFWPPDGGMGLLPAGRTTFDLEQGEVTTPDGETQEMSSSLDDVGMSYAQSLYVDPSFSHASIRVQAPEAFGKEPRTKSLYLDEQHSTVRALPMVELELYLDLPGAAVLAFGEDPDQPPVTPSGAESIMFRRGSLTTADDLQPVVMRPVVENPKTMKEAVMGEALAQKNAILDAKVVRKPGAKQGAWIVRNTGENPAKLNVEGAHRPVEAYFVEDPVTQSGDTLDAGDLVVLEPSGFHKFERLRAKSQTTGQSTTLEVDYGHINAI